jgi:hypothetical protein
MLTSRLKGQGGQGGIPTARSRQGRSPRRRHSARSRCRVVDHGRTGGDVGVMAMGGMDELEWLAGSWNV